MPAAKPDRRTKPASVSNAGSARRKRSRVKTPAARSAAHAVPKSKPEAIRPDLPQSARFVSEVRTGLGVTREFFARMTGFSIRAISGWERGRPLSETAFRRVKEMQRLRDALADGLEPRFIPRWLNTPCEGLGCLKPVEVLERGEADRLWRTVFLIGSGMPT
jgi:DNA-binding transcriptional regulator YiaG